MRVQSVKPAPSIGGASVPHTAVEFEEKETVREKVIRFCEVSDNLKDVVFDGCFFSYVSFDYRSLERVTFLNCFFENVGFSWTLFDRVTFDGCQIWGTDFRFAEFKNCFRSEGSWQENLWRSAKVENSNFMKGENDAVC